MPNEPTEKAACLQADTHRQAGAGLMRSPVMTGEWSEHLFSEAVMVNPSTPLKRGKVYPFVEMSAINPGNRDVRFSEHREFSGGGSKFQNRDALMARITPCLENGKLARFLAPANEPLGHGSTEFIVVRGRAEVTDNDFAYYLTISPYVRDFAISQMTGSSGRQRVPTDALGRLKVRIPNSIAEQKSIAHILGTLDDKIELNRKMNETLEAMAQALFKSWFVDFDPVIDNALAAGNPIPEELADRAERRKHASNARKTSASAEALAKAGFPDSFQPSELGPIPSGWESVPLYDTARYINGAAFKTHDFCASGEGLPVIKIAELKDGIGAQTKWSLRQAGPDQLIDTGDLIYSWSGSPDTSLDTFLWSNGRGLLNQHIFKVVAPSTSQKRFVYYLLKHLRPVLVATAKNKQTTGLGHVTVADMKRLLVCFPNKEILASFDRVVGPIFDKAFANTMETRTLATLRDTLLPKLLSGEIKFNPLEKYAKNSR